MKQRTFFMNFEKYFYSIKDSKGSLNIDALKKAFAGFLNVEELKDLYAKYLLEDE